jgi:hypothetical protein
MDKVDTPIIKPLPYFLSCLFFWKTFHDHGWTKWKFIILFGIPKTNKQEEDELVQREKKTFRLPYFQISYLFWTIYKTMETPFEVLQNLSEVQRQ